MNGITSSTALWYASRATGVVLLVLMTAVVVLGVLVNRRGRLPGLPGFAVTGLHRRISLLSAAFLATHVLTAIADPYVTIRLVAVVVPFTSAYKPFWLGLGAVALDLIAAIVVTSLLRRRIGHRAWRAVHWLGFAVWPVAFAHSLGASTDLHSGWLLVLGVTCGLAVAAACGTRAVLAARELPRWERAGALLGVPTEGPLTDPLDARGRPSHAAPVPTHYETAGQR